jgi:hypothetical protein
MSSMAYYGNLILNGSQGKLKNILYHPKIPSLNKEGTEA